MTRPVADTGARSTSARSAAAILGLFSRPLHVAAGIFITAGIIVQIIVSTQRLLTPVDIGGTLFGGAMSAAADAAIWMAATAGVLLIALLRLPGFRLAWIVTGGLPVVLGALTLWSYPDDYGGNLIYSPQQSEIAWVMALGGAFLVLGAILQRWITMPKPSGRRLRPLLMVLRMLAMAGLAVLFIAFPIMRQIEKSRPPLPPCAHDPMGKQLTLCPKAYVPPQESAK